MDPNSFLRTHIQGVVNHGLGTFTSYVDLNEYKHDSNMVLNTILRAIADTEVKVMCIHIVDYY